MRIDKIHVAYLITLIAQYCIHLIVVLFNAKIKIVDKKTKRDEVFVILFYSFYIIFLKLCIQIRSGVSKLGCYGCCLKNYHTFLYSTQDSSLYYTIYIFLFSSIILFRFCHHNCLMTSYPTFFPFLLHCLNFNHRNQ